MLLSYLHTMVVIAVLGMVLYNNRKIKATSTECETNPGPCPLRKKYMGYTASHLRSKGAIHNNPGSLQLQGPWWNAWPWSTTAIGLTRADTARFTLPSSLRFCVLLALPKVRDNTILNTSTMPTEFRDTQIRLGCKYSWVESSFANYCHELKLLSHCLDSARMKPLALLLRLG